MKKTMNAMLLTLVLLPAAIVACGHDHHDSSIGFGLTLARPTPSNPATNQYDVTVAAYQYGKDHSQLNSILAKDATINQVITASAAGIGLTTITTIIIAKLIEYVKNAKIRATKREIEIARLKAELARLQTTSVTAA